ncbi:ATP-dependent RNA helicase DDX51-like [Polyodon spathula]|uniref:ATP-dependent RNA helicase DDX51-like n=1 Tax=Polyodon spathula TaxID=7913 RepID=UPI001B7DB5EA|nr:ATP-dependent RNA helicase DDX51-like [Polyodon spathula]
MIDGMHQDWLSYVVKEVYRAQGSLELGSLFRRAEPGPVTAASLWQPHMPLQKMMFSATLTQNREKLQQQGLHQPRLFTSVHSENQRSGQGFEPHRTASGQIAEKFNFPQGLAIPKQICRVHMPTLMRFRGLNVPETVLKVTVQPSSSRTDYLCSVHRGEWRRLSSHLV